MTSPVGDLFQILEHLTSAVTLSRAGISAPAGLIIVWIVRFTAWRRWRFPGSRSTIAISSGWKRVTWASSMNRRKTVSDRPLALERCSSRAIPKLAAWPDTGWNCLLIIGDRQAGVRCREAASASEIGRAAVTGNFAAMIRCFYRIPADCYSVNEKTEPSRSDLQRRAHCTLTTDGINSDEPQR